MSQTDVDALDHTTSGQVDGRDSGDTWKHKHQPQRCSLPGAGRRLSVVRSAAKRAINWLVSAVSVPEVVDCTIEGLIDSTTAT